MTIHAVKQTKVMQVKQDVIEVANQFKLKGDKYNEVLFT